MRYCIIKPLIRFLINKVGEEVVHRPTTLSFTFMELLKPKNCKEMTKNRHRFHSLYQKEIIDDCRGIEYEQAY